MEIKLNVTYEMLCTLHSAMHDQAIGYLEMANGSINDMDVFSGYMESYRQCCVLREKFFELIERALEEGVE